MEALDLALVVDAMFRCSLGSNIFIINYAIPSVLALVNRVSHLKFSADAQIKAQLLIKSIRNCLKRIVLYR